MVVQVFSSSFKVRNKKIKNKNATGVSGMSVGADGLATGNQRSMMLSSMWTRDDVYFSTFTATI